MFMTDTTNWHGGLDENAYIITTNFVMLPNLLHCYDWLVFLILILIGLF